MRSRSLLVLLLVPVFAVPFIHARAQDQEDAPAPLRANRISVRTKAHVVAAADELELEVVVQGTSEDAREAEKKHRDRLRRLMASLTGKEVKDEDSTADDDESDKPKRKSKKVRKTADDADALPTPGVPDEDGLVYDVREGRYTLGVKGDPAQMAVDDPTDETTPKKETELACGSCVHVTLKNLGKASPKRIRKLLANILDRAADAGADLGPPKTHLKPTLRFRVANAEALKKQAYAEAVARGKDRAAYLAQLAGRQLGKLTVITDLPAGPSAPPEDGRVMDFEAYLAALQANDPQAPDTFSGSSEIEVEAGVELEFELH